MRDATPEPMPHRRRPRARQNATAGAFALLVAACGGGGGDPPAAPPQPEPTLVNRTVASGPTRVAPGCTGGRNSGTVFVDAEVEPFVAVSPTQPERLVGTWQQDRTSDGGARALATALSVDGGRSWQRTLHPMSRCGGAAAGTPGDHERASDPWVDIGPTGTVFLMGLAFSGANFAPGASNAMLVQRSLDGGQRWSEPVAVQSDGATHFNDKNTLTADPTDARFVYAVWDRLDTEGRGPTLLVRSTDQGLTWSAPVTVAEQRSVGTRDPDTGDRVRDGAIVPAVAAGPGGQLWLPWQDARFSNGARDAIALSRSADGGRSWSAPVAVNRNAEVAAFTPTLHVRADGTVGLMHFDLRSNTSDRDTLRADLWLLTSRDGVTWAETALERGFDLQRAPTAAGGLFLGDYHGLVSAQGDFLPLVALPGPDTGNRTEVLALRTAGPAGARFSARPGRVGALSVGDQARLDRSASEATAHWMEQRLPGWTARAQRPRGPTTGPAR